MSEKKELWERLDHEPLQAYDYFRYYCTLPNSARMQQVSEHFNLDIQTVYDYSSDYNWKARKVTWVDHINKVKIEEDLRAVREMSRRHARNSQAIERVTMAPVQEVLKRISNGDSEFQSMTTKELLRFVYETARVHSNTATVERLSRGQATEISKSDMDISTGGKPVTVILPTLFEDIQQGE